MRIASEGEIGKILLVTHNPVGIKLKPLLKATAHFTVVGRGKAGVDFVLLKPVLFFYVIVAFYGK